MSKLLYSRKIPYLAGAGVFIGMFISVYNLTLPYVAAGLAVFFISLLYFYIYIKSQDSLKECKSVIHMIILITCLGSIIGAALSGFTLTSALTATGISSALLILAALIEKV